jgi:MFS family permease
VRIDETGNWRAFRHRNFRILFAANTISNIGTWAQRIAQDWLVLQLTHSGTYLGLVTAAQFTPVLFFSLHGGAWADRFDKRKVLIGTNIAGGLSAGILGLLIVTHHVKLWHVFLLAFLLGVASMHRFVKVLWQKLWVLAMLEMRSALIQLISMREDSLGREFPVP